MVRLIFLFSLLITVGCGTRRVSTNIDKDKVKVEEKANVENEVKIENEKKKEENLPS